MKTENSFLNLDNNTSKTKDLIINNVLYANYIIENRTLYLKVRKNIVKDSIRNSEHILSEIISLIEKKEISYVSYLNIK